MREIKFRAWNVVTKNMIDLKKITPFVLDMDTDGLFIPFSDGLPLMQFTGEKDKNGKDIYEGDIVAWDKPVYDHDDESDEIKKKRVFSFIEYRNAGFWVEAENFGWEGENLWDWEQIEVIGNIYENPELLKKENTTP